MSAKKLPLNSISNYLVGMDKNNLDTKNPGFLGKVRSNYRGTEFIMFDRGENPKKVKD
jgi:tubby-related protein 1